MHYVQNSLLLMLLSGQSITLGLLELHVGVGTFGTALGATLTTEQQLDVAHLDHASDCIGSLRKLHWGDKVLETTLNTVEAFGLPIERLDLTTNTIT